jgi:hypothetical protein
VTWTANRLRNRIESFERLLQVERLATDAELESVAKSYPGKTKEQLWLRYAELKSYARRKEWQALKERRPATAESYDVAIAALEDRPETVELPSVDLRVRVTPASWARIMRVEDIDWWLHRLVASRMVLKADAGENLDELLDRVINEISHQKALLFAQVAAPTPAPWTDEPVEWADAITPLEEVGLLEAWHRVNTDLLRGLPQPKSRRDGKPLPQHWSIVFQSVAWREKRAPVDIIRDRSLVSVCAATALEAIKSEERNAHTHR